MAQYQTEAILLAVRDWGDADKLVTLFSRECGKISAVAYGARRAKSRLAGSLQLFTYVEATLFPGNKMDAIRQCEIKRSFRELREDLLCMAYGAFIVELVTELWPERQAEPPVFDLLLTIFGALKERNPRLTATAAAWQLLSLAGFQPVLEQCIICGQALIFPAKFDAEAGGGVCLACNKTDMPELSQEAVVFLQRLLTLDWKNPERFMVRGSVLMETEKMLRTYLFCRLDRHLRSLTFINQVTR